MKKLWRTLPSFVRWLLVTSLVMAIATGGAYAYIALTGRLSVTITEPLSWVGDSEFTVDAYPTETIIQPLTVSNAAPNDLEFNILYTVVPDPGADVNVSVPNKVTAPAGGQVSFNVTVTLSKSAAPITFDVNYEIDR